MKVLKKAGCILAIGILAVLSPVIGAAQNPAPAPATASTMTPDQAQQARAGKFIQDLGNHAITIITDKSLNQQQRAAKYSALLHDAFDLQTIGHFVAGRAYDSAPPQQQQQYMKLFEQLVIKIYGNRLNFYSGEKFVVKGVRQESDNDQIVSSVIEHPAGGAQPTTVDWRVREKNGKLAIIDVVVEGVSQSVTQRQEYAAIIQRDGGKLDGLLQEMQARIQAPDSNTGN